MESGDQELQRIKNKLIDTSEWFYDSIEDNFFKYLTNEFIWGYIKKNLIEKYVVAESLQEKTIEIKETAVNIHQEKL